MASIAKFDQWQNSAGVNRQTILQVVQTVKTDTWSTTSLASWQDVTGWTATITPYFSTSKILVMANCIGSNAGTNDFSFLKLVRNGTDIALGDARDSATRSIADLSQHAAGIASLWGKPASVVFLDSPASSSAVVYKMQCMQTTGSGILIGGTWSATGANRSNTPTVITLLEIAQ